MELHIVWKSDKKVSKLCFMSFEKSSNDYIVLRGTLTSLLYNRITRRVTELRLCN